MVEAMSDPQDRAEAVDADKLGGDDDDLRRSVPPDRPRVVPMAPLEGEDDGGDTEGMQLVDPADETVSGLDLESEVVARSVEPDEELSAEEAAVHPIDLPPDP